VCFGGAASSRGGRHRSGRHRGGRHRLSWAGVGWDSAGWWKGLPRPVPDRAAASPCLAVRLRQSRPGAARHPQLRPGRLGGHQVSARGRSCPSAPWDRSGRARLPGAGGAVSASVAGRRLSAVTRPALSLPGFGPLGASLNAAETRRIPASPVSRGRGGGGTAPCGSVGCRESVAGGTGRQNVPEATEALP